MKLNNKRNIAIYKKSIYAEQLYYYSKLCEVYKMLSDSSENLKSAEDVEKRYSRVLSDATYGDISYLDKQHTSFSKDEIDLIKQYAIFAQKFNDFRKFSQTLEEVLKNGK